MWRDLIGKKIVAFRGWKSEFSYILFDDKETYIELKKQDQYDYHDFNPLARVIEVRVDSAQWKEMMELSGNFVVVKNPRIDI